MKDGEQPDNGQQEQQKFTLTLRWNPQAQCVEPEFDPTEFRSFDMLIAVTESATDFFKFQRQAQWAQNLVQIMQQQNEANIRAVQKKQELDRLARKITR